jgi:predicted membrane-bound spermidine synthase
MKLPRYFFAFFFVSGFCGLVYEVIWLRLSMAKFGVTTPMVSIVLSVFMAGLGLGSWLGGKWMRRAAGGARTPLRLYGLLELLIGVSAYAAPATIDWGYRLLRDSGGGLAWASANYYLASGAWVTLALLPWCTCMGATFPFAMAAIKRMSAGASGHSFSFLYLANVLGAIAGTLVPAFVLIELFGFYGTLRIASVLNWLLAAAVFAVSAQVPAGKAEVQAAGAPVRKTEATRAALWLLFTTGLCSMAMEVIWIRQFTVYLGNVVYAFAAILAMYLAATFTGSLIYRRRVERGRANGELVWIAIGVAALLPLLFADPRLPLPEAQYTLQGFLFGALRAGLGVILFSGLAGYVTPMLVDEWSEGDPDRAGYAYAVNVAGSILGPLIAGFAVLPWAGEHWGLCIVTLPLFVAGARLGYRTPNRAASFAWCAVGAGLLLIFTKDYGTKFPARMELRDYAADVIATGEDMDKRLLVNGTGMTVLTPITKVMAHLPLTLLGRPADNVLVICFGMGTTFRSMMSWDLRTTAVELIPSVPKVYGYFHADGPKLLESPRARMVIDDGRRFLERSGEQYDVIAVDPPPPVSAPTSGLLYSRQFYAIMKPHLKPGGIVQVWFPGGDDATLASIARSFREAFPYVRTFESIEGWGIHFLGRMEPFPYPTGAELASRLPARAAADLIEWQEGETAPEMMNRVLAGEKKVEDLIAADPGVPGIADERPINEYFLLRSMGGK